MFNQKNRHFVFKQTSGAVCNFYYDQAYGLCFNTLSKHNTWNEPSVLQKSVLPHFYVDMDTSDLFHIVFQDIHGNIFYSTLEKELKTIPILKSKSESQYDKFLFLIPFKKDVHFFYVIKHDSSYILAYETLNGGNLTTPKVIDYVNYNDIPYSAVKDNLGNVYIFYQSSDGKYLQLGYKKYSLTAKTFTEFSPITRYNGDSQYPMPVISNNGIMHICYQRKSEKSYELVYQQKINDKNLWTNETLIHSSAYMFNNSYIVALKEQLVVFWVREDVIYCSSSNDMGDSWSKPSKFNFGTSKQLICMSFKSNHVNDMLNTSMAYVPGNYTNGYKIAFQNENSNNISVDDFKIMIIEGLKDLTKATENQMQQIEKLNDEISRIKISNINLEKEVVKQSIKLGILEEKIKKSQYSNPTNNNWIAKGKKCKPRVRLIRLDDKKCFLRKTST